MAEQQQPQKKAIALRYDEGQDGAPVVVASGTGVVAEQIIRLAEEAGIPVQTDAQLLAALSRLDLGEMIPPDLYPAVAEVLAFIGRMNAQRAVKSGAKRTDPRHVPAKLEHNVLVGPGASP